MNSRLTGLNAVTDRPTGWLTVAIRTALAIVLVACFAWIGWVLLDHAIAARRAPVGWRQIRAGMSAPQVVALLGEPKSRMLITPAAAAVGRVAQTQELWHYTFGVDGRDALLGRYVVTLTNGAVASREIR